MTADKVEVCVRKRALTERRFLGDNELLSCIEDMERAGKFVHRVGCVGCPFYPKEWER